VTLYSLLEKKRKGKKKKKKKMKKKNKRQLNVVVDDKTVYQLVNYKVVEN
jgi:hypothetical protein